MCLRQFMKSTLSFHFDPGSIPQTLNDCHVIIVSARYGGENCPCPVLLMEALSRC